MWVGLDRSLEGLTRTRGRVKENSPSLPDSLTGDIRLLLQFSYKSHHRFSWVSGLHMRTESTLLALPGLQLADGRLWDLSASVIM